MSQTPRTDADYNLHGGSVCPEFCRQLEKELNSLTKERDDSYEEVVVPLVAERDALKAKLEKINCIASALFARTTSSEVTGEMAEIGRLSRADGI